MFSTNERLAKLEQAVGELKGELKAGCAWNNPVAMQEAAAKQQATEHLYAPLRTNTGPLLKLAELARRMLDPDDLGPHVTARVQYLAREALGIAEEK